MVGRARKRTVPCGPSWTGATDPSFTPLLPITYVFHVRVDTRVSFLREAGFRGPSGPSEGDRGITKRTQLCFSVILTESRIVSKDLVAWRTSYVYDRWLQPRQRPPSSDDDSPCGLRVVYTRHNVAWCFSFFLSFLSSFSFFSFYFFILLFLFLFFLFFSSFTHLCCCWNFHSFV